MSVFRRKRKANIFGFKHALEGGIRKIITFVKLRLKFSGKQYGGPCNFEKTQVPLGNRTDTNFIASLKRHF